MLYVPFEKCYATGSQDPKLTARLCLELSGVFNWAIEGWQSLRSRGSFIEPKKCVEAVERYRRDINPARNFLLDNYAFSFEFEGLSCKEVYDAYVEWCLENGCRPLNSANFGKEVKRAFAGVAKIYLRERGRRNWFYYGLAAKEGSEVSTSKTTVRG